MNKEQFARCPFCGKSETLTIGKASDAFSEPDECGDPSPYMHTETYAVVCDASKPDGPGGCGASGGYKPTEDDAIAAWNRRAEAVASQPPAQAEPAPAQHQAKALEGVEPVAYRFTENRGNGYTEFNYYGLDEVGSAYRDNCLEIVPLYSAATVSALQARIAELEVDAARYRKLLELWNGRDMRELFGIEDFAAIDAARKESK